MGLPGAWCIMAPSRSPCQAALPVALEASVPCATEGWSGAAQCVLLPSSHPQDGDTRPGGTLPIVLFSRSSTGWRGPVLDVPRRWVTLEPCLCPVLAMARAAGQMYLGATTVLRTVPPHCKHTVLFKSPGIHSEFFVRQ